MAEVKKAVAENPNEILKKVRKIRPAGSVKEILELANKMVKQGKFVYDDKAGRIDYVKGGK